MSFRRSILVAVVAACGLLGFGASPAAARPIGYPSTISSAHFQIHYTGDALATDRIVDQTAADLDAIAERAYATITQTYGYPAPLDDGDGKIDIWVGGTGDPEVAGFAVPDAAANQSSGYIVLDPGSLNAHVVAHELFHLVQFGIWRPADGWLLESTAEWTGFRFENFPQGVAGSLGAPDMSLDCIGDKCGNDDYERGGYSRWSFFEYLSERFGGTIVKDILDRAATVANPGYPAISDVSDVLASKGVTLASAFTDWTVANLNGNYTATGLEGVSPAAYSTTYAGSVTGSLPAQTVSVDHLAARYLVFRRGEGSSDSACYAATLRLSVALPAGSAAKPYFYWSAPGSSPVPLALSGGAASITVPWDTCAWADSGYLLLQNPDGAADAQVFTVTGSVTVDKRTPASSFDPPPPASIFGPTIAAPTTDPAPTLTVHAPEMLRVSASDRLLRFIVFSTGSGRLRASLGATELGSAPLQSGNNDVRFVLPKSTFATLRSASEPAPAHERLAARSRGLDHDASRRAAEAAPETPPPLAASLWSRI